jgi:ElaB/YqjD/DUF883 family membrane-anchored ribosome-binding protein
MNKDPSSYVPEAVGYAAETADRLGQSAIEAKDAAAEAARRAQIEFQKIRTELTRVAARTEELAKENPWATAGTMLGVGVLLGAIGYRLFAPKPTLAEVLGVSHLPDVARSQAKKQMKAFKKLF